MNPPPTKPPLCKALGHFPGLAISATTKRNRIKKHLLAHPLAHMTPNTRAGTENDPATI